VLDGQRTEQARKLIELCRANGLMIGTAESCTGGLLAACLTALPGSSHVFDRGFVTYSNGAKAEMLGVDPGLIEMHGAVSREVAAAMVEGVLNRAPVDIAVSVTGIAGPGGGSSEKPVGLVFIGWGRRADGEEGISVERCVFGEAGRSVVRDRTLAVALDRLQQLARRN